MAEKPEDFNMPSNVVSKIIRDSLPSGVSVSPDVRSASARSASIFILYLTTNANNIAISHKRKTLSAQDVIDAINQIGFESFAEDLNEYHNNFLTQKQLKQRLKNSLKETNKSSEKSLSPMEDNDNEEEEEEEEEEDSDCSDSNESKDN